MKKDSSPITIPSSNDVHLFVLAYYAVWRSANGCPTVGSTVGPAAKGSAWIPKINDNDNR